MSIMSSPMDFLTECYYKESIETIKQVYSTLNKDSVNIDELLEGFKNMYRPTKMTTTNSDKTIKAKITRVQKELTTEERCVATKKDNTRCKGKKLSSGKNPELCSLHNNAIHKKSKVTITAKEITEVICDHMFTKGANKGKQCTRSPMTNDTKCRLHSDNALDLESNSSKTSSVTKEIKSEPKKNKKSVVNKVEEYIEPEFEEDLGLNYSEDENEEVYEDEENFE